MFATQTKESLLSGNVYLQKNFQTTDTPTLKTPLLEKLLPGLDFFTCVGFCVCIITALKVYSATKWVTIVLPWQKNRFQFLMANIRFDDEETRAERWSSDRFAAFREVFEMSNTQCGKVISPNDYLSLDETLYPMRNQVTFKQFNPSKPAKYGFLFKSINAARYPYTFIAVPYSGKPVGEAGDFYISGCDETVKSLIARLEKSTDLKGRNVSFDCLYTSIPLCKWLLEHQITSIGTLKTNRRGIPDEFTSLEGREGFSYKVLWEVPNKKLVLHSYVFKNKSSGLCNVLMLSTVQPLLGVTKDDKKFKPAIYKLYDFAKGGTDIVDQRVGFYSCKSKMPRWTMAALFFLLDICRVIPTQYSASTRRRIQESKSHLSKAGNWAWNLFSQP